MCGESGLDTNAEGALVKLDGRLAALDPEKAAKAVSVLNGFVIDLLHEFKDELHEERSHWRVLDFEIIHDVLRQEEGVYGKIVAAALGIAEKDDERKVVLTDGTKKDIERYLRYMIQSLARGAKQLQTTLGVDDLIGLGGVFKDKRWKKVKGYLGKLGECRKEFRVLAYILTHCSVSFRELGIGDERRFLDKHVKEKYEKMLREWSDSRVRITQRTDEANDADASTLATLHTMADKGPDKIKLHLVTATRALGDVCEGDQKVSLLDPLYFYLSQRVREFYRTPLLRLDFCYQCAKEILQLEQGFNLVRYGAKTHESVRRAHVQELLGAWESVLKDGALSQIRDWFEMAAAYSVNRWITSPENIRGTVDCRVPWVEIARIVSEGRQLLVRLLGDDADMLSLIGGRWLDSDELPGGKRHRLVLDMPRCEFTLEAFKGHYSLYWDADCTVADFFGLVSELTHAKRLKPTHVTLVCSTGDEMSFPPPVKFDVAFLREGLQGRTPSMVIVESADVDVYYEFCSLAANTDAIVATNILDRIRRARVAVVSSSKADGPVGELCERTARAYISQSDFKYLFTDKLSAVFD